jgi:hypothetical protein
LTVFSLPLELITLSESFTAELSKISQQLGATPGASSAAQDVVLLAVQHMERMGVCGNGICEVGEQPLQDSWNLHQKSAQGPCPQVRVS